MDFGLLTAGALKCPKGGAIDVLMGQGFIAKVLNIDEYFEPINMGKDASDSYLSSTTDEQPRSFRMPGRLSMGSMDEKLRRINEEFKARACVGNGFVFNRSVRLEPAASYFEKGDSLSSKSDQVLGRSSSPRTQDESRGGNVNKPKAREGFIGGMIPWKVGLSGPPNRDIIRKEKSRGGMVGMDLYKKPPIDIAPQTLQSGNVTGCTDSSSKLGYVKTIASSSMFNRESLSVDSNDFRKKTPTPSAPKTMIHSSGEILSPSRDMMGSSRSGFRTPSPFDRIRSQTPSLLSFKSILSHGKLDQSQASSTRSQSPALAPIDVMYVKSMPEGGPGAEALGGHRDALSPKWPSTRNTLSTCNFYAPGHKLTVYPQIRISNTVLCYEGSTETTKYYITIDSDVSWTVCKSIGDIVAFVPGIQCTTLTSAMSPQDRRARDRMIHAALNSGLEDGQLQSFILSDISSFATSRSSYLLMNNEGWKAYLFKFVGKALICYEKTKVFKILLLSGCKISPLGRDGFALEKSGEIIELYTTCERERDAWISDIREYIAKL